MESRCLQQSPFLRDRRVPKPMCKRQWRSSSRTRKTGWNCGLYEWISCCTCKKKLCIYILLYDMWYMWIWYKSTHNFSSIHILQCSVTSLMWLLAFCTCINETFRKTWKSKGPPKDSLTAAVPGQGCRGTKIPVVGGRGPPVPDGQTDDKLLDVGVSYFRTKPGSWTQAGPDMKDPQKK